MKEIYGDLIQLALSGEFDVILHGCNCYCQMDKGIALTIKNQFPAAYKADRKTDKGSKKKLGNYSFADVKTENGQLTILNAYTQFDWKGKGIKADYEAIRKVMKKVKKNYAGKRIGYPLIGAGLAGGNWDVIMDIINEELADEDHTLVRYER